MQFLERRLLRQKADLPDPSAAATLEKRCNGLKAHLYQWPRGLPVWYVPQDIISSYGLPPVLQLRQGQTPGDLLNGFFHDLDRLKRRQVELAKRIEMSKLELERFQDAVHLAAEEVAQMPPVTLGALSSLGPRTQALCGLLGVSWEKMEQEHREEAAHEQRKLPYRQFRASTGEFIRVAKSASEGDAMLKLMPSHHFWLHILGGEGSHVWLEKPKKSVPSATAVREAGILAVHHSKSGRGQSGEVQLAQRSDVEKRKDLPPGKVLVRRCTSQVIRYSQVELHALYQTLAGTA